MIKKEKRKKLPRTVTYGTSALYAEKSSITSALRGLQWEMASVYV